MKSPTYPEFQHWGVVQDLPPEEVAPDTWTAVINMQFQEQSTIRVGGYEQYASPLLGSGVIFAHAVLVGGSSYWIYCSTTHVYVTDGTLHYDITPVAGLTACKAGDWTATTLNSIPVLNNGIDPPMYWPLGVTDDCLTLPGWPVGAYCKAIRAFKYHLFALNVFDTAQQPDTLWWSAAAAPGAIPQVWVPAPDNDAGDMVLADTMGGIVDGLGLRDTFIVYKQFASYALSYVAGQYTYVQRKLFLTTGIQTSNCVAEHNGRHWIFTGNDVIYHDGQSFKSVAQDKVKNVLVQSIDPEKINLTCCISRVKEQQFWVCIASQGNEYLNRAYVVNTDTLDVGLITLPQVAHVARGIVTKANPVLTWDSDAQPWNDDALKWDEQAYSPTEDSLLLSLPITNQLMNHGLNTGADGQAIYATCERLSIPVQDNITHALITRVVPRVEGEVGDVINVSVGGQSYFGQSITWDGPYPFTIGSTVGINTQTSGRLMSIRFEASTIKPWTIHSYRLGVADLGLY